MTEGEQFIEKYGANLARVIDRVVRGEFELGGIYMGAYRVKVEPVEDEAAQDG